VSRAVLSAGADVVAFDISTHMLLAARRGGVSLAVCGALPELPFLDGAFGVVVSAFVLTHVDDADASVREMRRVLKRGGRIALSSWAAADDVYTAACAEIVAEFIDLARVAEAAQRVLPGEARFSQPDGLASLLEACGLRGVRSECRTFEFACSVDELVASREVCASGRALRVLLTDEQYLAYRARSLEVLGKKFPEGIRYPRQVFFAAGVVA
jgi:SAM-dependent methyltransferase